MSLRKPIKIGKYEVIGLLGKGGMGVVYKATDPLLGRSVAIKMMTTVDYVDNPDLLQRFYREAQSTGNLHHRNIVTVYELGDQEGSPYLVMEYLEGETLDALIQSHRPLPLLDRINFILEVCDGLAYAHQRSVVHRDIKPGNIMVLKDSEVKIVDFGIAHIGNRTVTRTGQLLGSLPYMSPEQISGKSVDARTDIFSLGVVFYQLLTAHLPFEGETPAATLLKIMHEQPRPLKDYLETFPPELDDILLRALAKDREERYSTAQDLAFDLVQIRGRLQQEIVEEHLNEAESLLAREELLRAREKLNEVLKIDRHNTRGVELSRAIQQRIQQQEAGQQVRQLRGQAEDAFQKEQFVLALELIQKAIHLHSTDPDLQRFRASVQQAKTKAEQLQRTLKRAEAAYEQGELDSAKQAIDEAIALAPEDVHAKSLYRTIQRDWTQRAQRLQVQSLIEEARKELASRNFTVAIEVLRKAEAIDPTAPQLRALIEAAQAAREQERRRKALEAAKREIEADLDRDDFQVACTRAEAALQDFPDDRGLQKLKELAEKQRVLAERKFFIEEQVSRARKLLEAGRTEEVLELLQAAKQSVGTDPHLDSLLVVVRDTLERQRTEARKQEFLRRAKDQLRLKQYPDAVRTLEAAQSELGSNPEIDDLLQFTVEQQNADHRRQIADAAAEKAQALVKDQDYEKAVEVLEMALQEAPDEELRIILVQARHAAADHRKLLEDALANTESMIQGQRPIEALKYLQSQPASFSRDARFGALQQKATQQAERLQQIEQALAKARVHFARDEFDTAHAVLRECVRLHGRTPELNKFLAEIEQRQTQAVAETLEKALAESRAFMGDGKPDEAIERLSSVQTIVGRVSPKLSNAYQALQQEATNARARKYKSDIEQLLAKGEHEEAAALLQRAENEFPSNRELRQVNKALEQATQRRVDAEKLLARAHELFQQQAWREGGDACLRTASLSTRDPVARHRALSLLESAANEVVDKEWRHAEFLLQCMSQLQANVPLPPTIREKINEARQDESIRETIDEARQFRERGAIDAALEALARGLTQHPSEPRLTRLQETLQQEQGEKEALARQERDRKEREDYVGSVHRRLRRDATIDGRVRVLQEALQRYPGDPTLENDLAQAQALGAKVNALVTEAQSLEAARNYEEAIRNWSAISELGVSHPDAEGAILRLRRVQEEARLAAKAAWLRGIRDSLAAFDLDSADSLLADAQREFRNDPDLAELASRRDNASKQREAALTLLSQAQEELKVQGWRPASDLALRSLQIAAGDPAVSTGAAEIFLDGTRSALSSDLSAAEMLLDNAAKIRPDAPEVAGLRNAVERQVREEIVNRRLADARAVAQAGDAERALNDINHAYSDFPDEPRVLALKQELEREIERERKAEADRNRFVEILDAAQGLRQNGDLPGALRKIKDGLELFPGHSQFLEMKRSVENAIREQEERQRREEKRRQLELQEENRRQQEEKKRREVEEAQKRKAAAEEAERLRRKQEADRKALEEAERKKQAEEAKRKKAAKVAQIPVEKSSPKGSEAHVWRGAALPEEVAHPQPMPVPAARRASATGAAAPPPRPIKLYIAIGVMAVALAVLGPAVWRAAHHNGPLEPVTKAIQIVTTPVGATVRVPDSGASCVTPQCTLDLVPGEHQIEVSLPGYQALQKSISVDSVSNNPITLVLVPEPPKTAPSNTAPSTPEVAHLELRDVPPGTVVVVDDKRLGRVGRQGTFSATLPPGSHQVQLQALNQATEAVQRDFANGGRVELSSSDFPAPKPAVAPPVAVSQQGEWNQLKDSQNIQAFDDFLKRYPKGPFTASAQSKLEDLYWAKATGTNSARDYSQYLDRFPNGRYSQQAQNELVGLEWKSVETTSDIAALQNFLRKYPSGTYHDKGAVRLDDLSWQHTAQNDVSALRSYLTSFPDGRHSAEARKKVEDLTRVASVAKAPESHNPPQTVVIDDNKAILDILSRYQKAYETGDLQELQKVWPGMTTTSSQGLVDFFRQASGISMQYQVKQLEINGDHATLRFTQSIRYSVEGRPQKNTAKIVMQLSRASGVLGEWHIDSIR